MPKSASSHSNSDIAWDDVRLFLAIAETGSLSAAAKLLRLGQPTVSRRLAELEDELGYPLFRRHVGGAALTAEGERLLEPSRKMAEWAGEFGRVQARGQRAPEGEVRIAAPPGIAFDFVAPFAGWLKTKHPQLRVSALCSVQYLDLARREADLALRWKAPTSPDLKVVATLRHANAVFVSKEYAARLPRRPKLADLDWIAWAPPFEDVPPNPQLAELVPNFRPVFTSDNFLVKHRAAECGLGAIFLGNFHHRFRRPTTLVPLPIELGPFAHSELHLVCAKSALEISRVRVVAELLAAELERAGGS